MKTVPYRKPMSPLRMGQYVYSKGHSVLAIRRVTMYYVNIMNRKGMYMLEILKAILFGIVEGITEWLPVSSTGHLILLNEFIKLQVSEEFSSMFDVVIQLGAILAVILLFFRKLNPLDKRKSEKQRVKTWRLWFMVIIAIIPSGLLGVLLDDWMDAIEKSVPAKFLELNKKAFMLGREA